MLDTALHQHVSDDMLETAVDFTRFRRAGLAGAWWWMAVTECPRCWERFNDLRWDRSKEHSELKELATYLGPKFEYGRDGTWALAERWRRSDPQTAEEIEDFYRTADDYLYDLALFHASGERMDYVGELSLLADRFDCENGLDYGCGIGSDGLELTASGLPTSFMDYRNPSTAYLRWRLRQRGLDDHLLRYVGEDEIPFADLVFALDVFEHLTEPETMAEVLAGRTARVLVYNLLFRVDSDTICPMHLPDHDPAGTAAAIEDRMSTLGFVRIEDDPLLTVWVRGQEQWQVSDLPDHR